MTRRALTLALRLLTTACAGAALGSLTACPFFFDCPEPWSEVESVDLGTSEDIIALGPGRDYDRYFALTDGGRIVSYDGDTATSQDPQVGVLRALSLAGSRLIAVGDGGAVLVSDDDGASWEPRSSGTSADLIDLTYLSASSGAYVLAIGAETLLLSSDDGDSWVEIPPPLGGWGGLRAVLGNTSSAWVVGDNGTAWGATDPTGNWLAQDLGTTAGLIAGGRVSGESYSSSLAVVGNDGSILFYDGDSWTPLSAELDGSVAAFGDGFLVTSNGRVYDIEEGGAMTAVANVGLVPRAITGSWSGFLVAGEGGNAARAYYRECVGGRPWIARSGAPRRAELVARADWRSDELGELPPSLSAEQRERLAAAWAADGLDEHASIASFARFADELLSLAAPAELLHATARAMADEVEHARLCFGLARRYGGVDFGPDRLEIPADELRDRCADPIAVALALFDEGCINESVAAAEAGVAAEGCSDPCARAVLERIAADERRHAALAWRALAWLLATHRSAVGSALSGRLRALTTTLVTAGSAVDPGSEPGGDLHAHGRLGPGARSEIQAEIVRGMIVPLLRTMLEGARISP